MQRDVETLRSILVGFDHKFLGENDGQQQHYAPCFDVDRAKSVDSKNQQSDVFPLVALEERRLERVTLRPGETRDVARICITAPQFAEHEERLAWKHIITMREGSARFELTTRYGDTTRRDVITLGEGVQGRDGRTTNLLKEGRAHSIFKSIPGRDSLPPGGGPVWMVLTLDNKHARSYFGNGPDVVFDIHSTVVPAFSTEEEESRTQWLKAIMDEGTAANLANLFVELGYLRDEERNKYIAAISQHEVLSEIAKELQSVDAQNWYGDIGAEHGKRAGGVTGFCAGVAVLGSVASFPLSVPLAAKLSAGAVCAATCGGAVLGGKIGSVITTSACSMKDLLEKFVAVMRKISYTTTLKVDEVLNLLQQMNEIRESISISQQLQARKAAENLFEKALKQAQLPRGYARLMVALLLLLVGVTMKGECTEKRHMYIESDIDADTYTDNNADMEISPDEEDGDADGGDANAGSNGMGYYQIAYREHGTIQPQFKIR